MRKNRGTVNEELILDGDVVSKNGDVLHSGPSTDDRVPSNDGAHDPRVLLHLGVGHDDTSLQTDACANLATRSDHHVGSNQCRRVNLGRL